MRLWILLLPLFLVDATRAEPADQDSAATGEVEASAPAEESLSEAREVVTQHRIQLGGKDLDYEATTGVLPLRDAKGETTAEIFYIAYTRIGKTDVSKRPLTFSFNGGPGSCSVWLHLGLLGPKRVQLQDNGFAVPPPYQLVTNEHSLLDETDLVFIDPVGTGFSRASDPEKAKEFYGLKEDAASVAEFIRLYVTRENRWPSPKFLIGESYGTTRAAALSGELLRRHQMNLNGIMLVSTVLNFQTIWGGEGNDLPHILYLPSYAATAWYHQRLEAGLQALPLKQVLQRAERFAVGRYSSALLQGRSLPPAERTAVVAEMATLTGLDPDFVEHSNLRVPLSHFNAELLRDQNKVIGRFDSRYTSPVQDPLSRHAERDPSADAIFSAFASTFHHYLRTDLEFEDDRPYHIFAKDIGRWNWDAENRFATVTPTLADSMTANPFLKIHVSNGIYDLATPYFAVRYTLDHLRIDPSLFDNITQDDYNAGHMMYLNLPDLKKQKTDLARFIRSSK